MPLRISRNTAAFVIFVSMPFLSRSLCESAKRFLNSTALFSSVVSRIPSSRKLLDAVFPAFYEKGFSIRGWNKGRMLNFGNRLFQVIEVARTFIAVCSRMHYTCYAVISGSAAASVV
jgi:hypothetical protein